MKPRLRAAASISVAGISCLRIDSAAANVSGEARSGRPSPKGGCGAYSMSSSANFPFSKPSLSSISRMMLGSLAEKSRTDSCARGPRCHPPNPGGATAARMTPNALTDIRSGLLKNDRTSDHRAGLKRCGSTYLFLDGWFISLPAAPRMFARRFCRRASRRYRWQTEHYKTANFPTRGCTLFLLR
jgi:hypothetical protein